MKAGDLLIDESEIVETFMRSSGPGGQNVNKLSTAVQLRFDVRGSPSLTEAVRERLERLAGSRLTRDGVLVIIAQRHRTQERNRADARERLVELIERASIAPTPRRPVVYRLSCTATSSLITTLTTSISSAWASSAAISKFSTSPV